MCQGSRSPHLESFNYWIKHVLSKDELDTVIQICMDETLRKKGHNYVTIFADLDQRRVIHVCEGKDASTVEDLTAALKSIGGSKEKIEIISMDMSPVFICGVMDNLPDAQLVLDKFNLT